MRPALVLSALVAGALAAVPADLITSLPGWSGALPSNQYSGLVKYVVPMASWWSGGCGMGCCHGLARPQYTPPPLSLPSRVHQAVPQQWQEPALLVCGVPERLHRCQRPCYPVVEWRWVATLRCNCVCVVSRRQWVGAHGLARVLHAAPSPPASSPLPCLEMTQWCHAVPGCGPWHAWLACLGSVWCVRALGWGCKTLARTPPALHPRPLTTSHARTPTTGP